MAHVGRLPYFRWIDTAVPLFMRTSFYLTAHVYNSPHFSKTRRRVFRICVPYFGYAFISFVVVSFVNVLNKKSILPFKDLLWQLFLGSSPNLDPPLWFLADLFFCSIIIFLVSKYIAHKKFLFFLLILMAFLLQYTGINFFLFSWMPYEAKWTLGRLMEMLPYACGGILLADSQLLKKYSGNILFIFFITLLILFFKSHLFPNPEGFLYQGLSQFINTLLVFSLFYLGNLEELSPKIKRIILSISEYSLGIYCIHYIILLISYQSALTIFHAPSAMKGILIYFISLSIAVIIGKIPSKWVSALVK